MKLPCFSGITRPDAAAAPAAAGRRLIVCLSGASIRWASFDGTVWQSGSGLDTLDPAVRSGVRAEVRVPAQETLLLRLDLPTANRARIAQALPYALEEQLVGEPADFEFAYRVLAPGKLAVAATARATLAGWQQPLLEAGVRPQALVPLNLTLPWAAGQWTLADDEGVLLVRTGPVDGFALLHGNADATDWIQSALREAAEPPERLQIIPGAEMRVRAEALGIPVIGGTWQPCRPTEGAVALNLLAGLESTTEYPLWIALRPAARVLGAWLVVGLLLHMVLWVRWHRIAQAQQSQMLALFERSFPRESEIVDPPLQMQRDLAALRQRSGEVGANDLLPLLTRLSGAFGGTQAPLLRNLDYRSGRLRISIEVSGFAALDTLKRQLRAQGLQVKVLNADSTANGQVHGTLEIRSSTA